MALRDGRTDTRSRERGEGSTAPEHHATAATDHLHRVHEHSLDGRRIEGRIEEVIPGTDSVRLIVRRLTDDGRVRDAFPVPHPWDERSRLARLLDAHGYAPGAIELLEGDRVTLIEDAGRWRIELPRDGGPDLGRPAVAAVVLALSLGLLPPGIGALLGLGGIWLPALGLAGAGLAVAVLWAAGLALAGVVVAGQARRWLRRRRAAWRRFRFWR
jgi:hypothetical protein